MSNAVYFDGISHEVFDCLGDVVVCTKDRDGRYLSVNQAFIERSPANDESEVLGKTAAELLHPVLAKIYTEQDRRVISTGKPLRDQLELIEHSDGSIGWYLANKFPIFDRHGNLIGIVGTSQDLKTPSDSDLDLYELRSTIDYIHKHLDQPLKAEDMANRIGLSLTQLDRRMKRIFRLSTKQYIMKRRLDLASELLATTDRTLADIAASCGFSDQSAFTRHFRSAANVTPLAYRKSKQTPSEST